MKPDYSDLEFLAKQKEKENWRFRRFLKSRCDLPDEQIDSLVFEIADEVAAGIDCLRCGRCCRDCEPILSDDDRRRLATRLGLTVERLQQQVLRYEDSVWDPGWTFRQKPCPFLGIDNVCSVYEDRPDNCRDYPYLHEPDFVARSMGMIGRTFTCPIVFEVVERLKRRLGYH